MSKSILLLAKEQNLDIEILCISKQKDSPKLILKGEPIHAISSKDYEEAAWWIFFIIASTVCFKVIEDIAEFDLYSDQLIAKADPEDVHHYTDDWTPKHRTAIAEWLNKDE